MATEVEMSVQVFPTRNIHLVSAFPDAQMNLSLCVDWPPNASPQAWTDLINGAHGVPLFTRAQPLVAASAIPSVGNASPTGISLRAGAVGAQFYQLGAAVPGAPLVFVVVRVATHSDIARLHVPYGDIYVFAATNNFVLTVFADFTDGESWDVSEHPYLEFDTADHSIATIDSSGRITAVAAGTTTITIQPTGRPAMSVQCNVHVDTVASWVATQRVVVKRGRQPAAATRKLFLVSEGYTDAARFDKHASEIADRIFSEANAPFQLVKSQFSVTRVFVRSAGAGGISIGPPLVAPSAGTRWTIDAGTQVVTNGTYAPASVGAFGFTYGQRVGDVDGVTFDVAHSGVTAQQAWIGNVAARSISMDLRRVGPYRTMAPLVMIDPRTSFVSELKALFAQLQLAFGPDDRIVFLIDDQMRGGAGFSIANIDVKPRQFVSLAVGTTNDWFDGVQPQTGSPFALRVPVADTYHADYAASSVTHELGHTFRLGDEYEGAGGRPDQVVAARTQMEEYENVQLTGDLVAGYSNPAQDPPPPYDLKRLKWTIPRAAKASLVTAVRSVSANTIVATIAGNAEKIWTQFEQVRLRTGFRAPRPRATDGSVDPNVPRLRDFPYEVQGIDGSNVILFSSAGNASGSTGNDLTDLCVLYLPVGDDIDHPVHVMDPVVEAYVTARGAFPRPAGILCTATNVDGQPPAIQSFTMPNIHADVVGVYQGGNYASCGVVRPSGRCKLRRAAVATPSAANILVPSEIVQFCSVCKTVIADQIDPSMLPKIK